MQVGERGDMDYAMYCMPLAETACSGTSPRIDVVTRGYGLMLGGASGSLRNTKYRNLLQRGSQYASPH